MSGTDVREGEGASALETNLVFHHGVTDIFNHPTEFIHVVSILQELHNIALLFQHVEVFEHVTQFAIDAG